MPLSLYTEFNNLNGLLPNIKDAIEFSDIFFLITCIIAITTFYILGRKTKPKNGYILPISFIFILLISFTYHFYSVQKDHEHLANHFKELNDKRTVWNTMYDRWQMMEHTMPKTGFYYYGLGPSLIFKGMNKVFGAKKFHFSEEEENTIKKYMYASDYYLPNDTIQNLIFILVESLSSYPINKSFNGIELTPNINKLIKKAYYNPNMESQALLGESSDGQFIYLTGLLPLKNGVTINEISAQQITTFVSLAKKQMPTLHSQMIIPTDKNSWSQEAMCKKYGIDTLFSKENFPFEVKEDWLTDKQLFEFASEKNNDLRPPFISFILTSSMHSPYNKSIEDYNIDYPKDFSSELKHYLDNVHYMDKHLGQYIESLKKHNWYDNCTLVITADHKPNGPKLNTNKESLFTELPLIIIMPSKNYSNLRISSKISQTSIFPTIQALYHIPTKWKGVGTSIFMPDSISHSHFERERREHQQIISDYIINKKYLN